MHTFALLGYPGAGKTWVISNMIQALLADGYKHQHRKIGLVEYEDFGGLRIMGNYDGSTFQGTDRLSMAVSVDFDRFFDNSDEAGAKFVLAEGDRINNMTFFKAASKHGTYERIKIQPDTYEKLLKQREQRGHTFDQRFLKSIASKVDKHTFDHTFNSDRALEYLHRYITNPSGPYALGPGH